jgi:hypothetical protein
MTIFESITLKIDHFFLTPISFCLLNKGEPQNLYIDFDIHSTSYCIFVNTKNLFHYNILNRRIRDN